MIDYYKVTCMLSSIMWFHDRKIFNEYIFLLSGEFHLTQFYIPLLQGKLLIK